MPHTLGTPPASVFGPGTVIGAEPGQEPSVAGDSKTGSSSKFAATKHLEDTSPEEYMAVLSGVHLIGAKRRGAVGPSFSSGRIGFRKNPNGQIIDEPCRHLCRFLRRSFSSSHCIPINRHRYIRS